MDNNHPDEVLGPRGLIKKHELIRVIIQCLYSLGYRTSAYWLELESHISYKSLQLVLLESQILKGNWDESIETLGEFKDLKDEETRAKALCMILRQCILECLIRGDDSSALAALRKDFSALRVSKEKIHNLASIIITRDTMGLNELDVSVIGEMRKKLVTELENLLPPPIVVPERRLECLVEMILYGQRYFCKYHNSSGAISLYEEHCCGKDHLPTETVQILRGHRNEVRFVQFSNKGEYLASSSSDGTAIIWKVPEHGIFTLKHTLRGHRNTVSFVSWSPDDTMLLTIGSEEALKLWDVETGTCKCTFSEQRPISSSCAWFPDSKRLVFGGDEHCMYMFNIDENDLNHLTNTDIPKIIDFAITPNGENIISIFSEKHIQIWNRKKDIERNICEEFAITSLSVSRDGNLFIVNLSDHEIHLWDVAGVMDRPLKFWGHQQERFVIRSCFGGLDGMFIASGSEDSQVYIWNWRHRAPNQPIEVLPGHSMAVNCVSWNPIRHQMLASASDDRTIRIWGPNGINENRPE